MTFEEPRNLDKTYEQLVGASLDNRYDIIGVVSSGGVGDVYKVRHREMEKVYAAKVMRASGQPSPESIKRFQREAQILCKLRHPNIVSVHAFGNDQQLGPYLIMDLLEGVDLHSLVKDNGPMPLERAGKLLIGICEGMSNAHKLGIVHRDIKPSNVMIVGEGREQRAVIIDFGAGKWLDAEEQKLTQDATVLGTPLYMAPEQCLAKGVDKRTDVYAMGCLMYEVLTGKPPFEGDSTFEVMQKHISLMPAPPSVANPKAKIPQQLDQVITIALQKQMDERLDTFTKIKEALEVSMQRPTYAKMFGIGNVVQDQARRVSRKNVGITLAVVSAVAVTSGVVFFAMRNHDKVSPQSVDIEKDTSREYIQMREDYGLLAQQHRTAEAIALGRKLIAHPRFLTEQRDRRGVLLVNIASAEISAGQYQDALKHAEMAEPLISDAVLRNTFQLVVVKAQVNLLLGNPKAAQRELDRLLSKRDFLYPSEVADLDFLESECSYLLGDFAKSAEYAREGLKAADSRPVRARMEGRLGQTLLRIGGAANNNEALRLLQSCISVHQSDPEMWSALALAYKANGDLEHASEAKRTTLDKLSMTKSVHVKESADEIRKSLDAIP